VSDLNKNKCLRSYLKELPDFVSSFILEYYSGESINTQVGYCLDIRVFLNYLCAEILPEVYTPDKVTVSDIDKITVSDLIHFKSYLKEYTIETVSVSGRPIKRVCKNSSYGINRKLSAVRGLFIYLYKTDKISQNITDKIDFMKLHQQIKKPLTTKETIDLIDVIYNGKNYYSGRNLAEYTRRRSRDIAVFTAYLGTGVRVSELANLDIEDIDFNNQSFIVRRKGGDQQEIFMPLQVENTIFAYLCGKEPEDLDSEENAKDILKPLRTSGPVFLNRSGRRLGVAGIEKMLKSYCLTAGITHPDKTRPHALRRTFACRLLEDGVDIKMVAELMGHKNIEVTHRYYAQYSAQARKDVMRGLDVYKKNM
jgi:integrase/recombinase XerC